MKIFSKQIYKNVLFVTLFFVSALSFSEPVTVLQNSGDSANRIDIVFLGDGYSAADIASGKYATLVNKVVSELFLEQPFLDYKDFFNVHRIDVTSVDSGVSHPENNVARNTALESYFNCSGIPRAVCLSKNGLKSARDIITRSVKNNQKDMIIVILNDPQDGGTAQAEFAITADTPDITGTVIHELAHTYGRLADEYSDVLIPCTVPTIEPSQANVTIETRRNFIKWNQGGGPVTGWIERNIAIPTIASPSTESVTGLFEGGLYCNQGIYRSSLTSKMTSTLLAFNSVSSEELIKKFYKQVSPIDSVTPNLTPVAVNNTQSFTVTTPILAKGNQNYEYTWLLNGKVVQSGNNKSYTFTDNGVLATGQASLDLIVKDTTTMVRYDPDLKTQAVASWILKSVNIAPRADLFIDRFVLLGDSVFADASFSEGQDLRFEFDMGDGTYLSTRTPFYIHQYRNAGNYLVGLTVIDTLGRQSKAFANVTVRN